MRKWIPIGLFLLVAGGFAIGQSVITSNQGKPGAYGAWFANSAAQLSMSQAEVLVLTTSTAIPTTGLVGRRSIEIQNLGPNSIFCSGGTPVVDKARKIGTGESWAIDISDTETLNCIAATANQVTAAATIVSEIK